MTRVLIAYDHDPAGDEAANTLATDLMAGGVECFRILFPYGTDANDVAVAAPNRPTLSVAVCGPPSGWERARRPPVARPARWGKVTSSDPKVTLAARS